MKTNLKNRFQKLAGLIKEQWEPNPGEPGAEQFDENTFVCSEGQTTAEGLCQDPQTWFSTYESIFSLTGGGFPNALNIDLTQCCENESFSASCPEGSSVIQAGEVPELAGTFNEFGFSTVTMPDGVPSHYADRCSTYETWYNHYENAGAIPGTADGGPNTFSMSSSTVEPVDQAYIARCCVMSEETTEEEPPTPQAMPVTVDTPGTPDPKKYKKGGTDPKYLKDKEKFLKKQKPKKLNESVIKRFQKLAGIKPEKNDMYN